MALNPVALQGFNSQFLRNNISQTNQSCYFPSDLADSKYWMSFSFYDYQRPSITAILSGELKPTVVQDQGTIRLPLPNQMIDHQDQDYDATSLGAVLNQALSMGGKTGETIKNIGAGIGAAAGLAGYAANPMMGVLYKSPAFKAHQLMWRLTPSSELESQKLNTIINNFKYHQLPETAVLGLAFKYPSIVQIAVSVNNPDTFSYVFRPAIIKSIEINFTPEGQPSFFNSTKGPTALEIRLSLLEIELWTKEDYGDGRYPIDTLKGWLKDLSDSARNFDANNIIEGTIFGTGA